MTLTHEHVPGMVSVIIPAFNAASFIRNAIDSAMAQSWPSMEIIVVNDGSNDDTPDILDSYKHEIRIINKSNGGLSSARNRGIQESTGEFVAFLDADDLWLPEKISRQVEALMNKPVIGFCSTQAVLMTPDGEHTGIWDCPGVDGSILKTLFLRNSAIPGSGSGVMVRRHLFEKAGTFDESLRSLEDIDMWIRLAAITNYVCIDEPLTIIVKHPDSMSRNISVMRSSALQVMRKNRTLLQPDDRGGLWRAAYAGVQADYAKWEYRIGRRMNAIAHLLLGLIHSPIARGRMILGLLLAIALGRPV
jgi:glycosyltransferase involved in cell wall biosynthesis